MLYLLMFPAMFLAGLAVYKYSEQRAAKKMAAKLASETAGRISEADSQACVRMIEITSTNNSYDPIGDVLSELDMDGVQTLLGTPLHADMEGYMK